MSVQPILLSIPLKSLKVRIVDEESETMGTKKLDAIQSISIPTNYNILRKLIIQNFNNIPEMFLFKQNDGKILHKSDEIDTQIKEDIREITIVTVQDVEDNVFQEEEKKKIENIEKKKKKGNLLLVVIYMKHFFIMI